MFSTASLIRGLREQFGDALDQDALKALVARDRCPTRTVAQRAGVVLVRDIGRIAQARSRVRRGLEAWPKLSLDRHRHSQLEVARDGSHRLANIALRTWKRRAHQWCGAFGSNWVEALGNELEVSASALESKGSRHDLACGEITPSPGLEERASGSRLSSDQTRLAIRDLGQESLLPSSLSSGVEGGHILIVGNDKKCRPSRIACATAKGHGHGRNRDKNYGRNYGRNYVDSRQERHRASVAPLVRYRAWRCGSQRRNALIENFFMKPLNRDCSRAKAAYLLVLGRKFEIWERFGTTREPLP